MLSEILKQQESILADVFYKQTWKYLDQALMSLKPVKYNGAIKSYHFTTPRLHLTLALQVLKDQTSMLGSKPQVQAPTGLKVTLAMQT